MLLWLVSAAAFAAPDAAHHLAQARLFERKGWLDDAWREVDAALSAPGGKQDPAVHALASSLAWQRRDAATSALHAHRVAALSEDPQTAAEARAWAERIDRRFGTLVVAAPHEGVAAALRIDGGPGLLGPDDRAYVADLQVRLGRRAPLPRAVSLPAGDWKVNGQPVAVPPGGRADVTLAEGGGGWQVLRVDVGGGMVVGLGDAARWWSPSPVVELGMSAPVGSWRLGGFVESAQLVVRDETEATRVDPGAVSLGARLAREIETGTPLLITPSASVRGGRFPGLACDAAPSCDGWGAAPGLGLVVGYRERGRTTALDSGVGVGVDAPLGAVGGAGFGLVRARLLAHLDFSL